MCICIHFKEVVEQAISADFLWSRVSHDISICTARKNGGFRTSSGPDLKVQLRLLAMATDSRILSLFCSHASECCDRLHAATLMSGMVVDPLQGEANTAITKVNSTGAVEICTESCLNRRGSRGAVAYVIIDTVCQARYQG